MAGVGGNARPKLLADCTARMPVLEPTDAAKLAFSRWGRGVSYYDFVIAWDIPRSQLPVFECAAQFHEGSYLAAPWATLIRDRDTCASRKCRLTQDAPLFRKHYVRCSSAS